MEDQGSKRNVHVCVVYLRKKLFIYDTFLSRNDQGTKDSTAQSILDPDPPLKIPCIAVILKSEDRYWALTDHKKCVVQSQRELNPLTQARHGQEKDLFK